LTDILKEIDPGLRSYLVYNWFKEALGKSVIVLNLQHAIVVQCAMSQKRKHKFLFFETKETQKMLFTECVSLVGSESAVICL